jgi:UPF0042 nucleotide-binding protein
MKHIKVLSFGYLHGEIPQADITIDMRLHYRDPHVSPELRELTAEDGAVRDAVLGTSGVIPLIVSLTDMVQAYMLGPSAETITVAIGCAGGRHRSAVVAESLYNQLNQPSSTHTVSLHHRDIKLPVVER